jgi:DnaJ-class molecular chaperone
MACLLLLPVATGFFDQLFQGAQFVQQPQKPRWPKGIRQEIAPDMAWMKGTEWHWNKWRNVKFAKDGTFEAPTQDCQMGMCEWAAYEGKVYVLWGDNGLHILEPNTPISKLAEQSQDELKKTFLKGKRKKDNDPIKATFTKIYDFEAFLVEKDLYGILQLTDEAADGDIKRQYRKLSKELHPDKNPSPEARKQFNDVRDAYEILSSPEQKILFDTGGMEAIQEHKKGQVQKGESSSHSVSVTLEMLYTGAEHPVSMSRRIVCRGCRTNPSKKICSTCQKCPNEVRTVHRPMGPGFMVQQQEEVKSNEKCKTEATTLQMNIEKGMKDGDTVVFEMMGEQRPKQIPGDVIFKLKQAKHKVFTRRGADLTMKMQVTLRQSLLGFERTVKHLDGHEVVVRREGITMPGSVMKVSGEGMPKKDDSSTFGELYIEFSVQFPETLSADQQAVIANNFKASTSDIRPQGSAEL